MAKDKSLPAWFVFLLMGAIVATVYLFPIQEVKQEAYKMQLDTKGQIVWIDVRAIAFEKK